MLSLENQGLYHHEAWEIVKDDVLLPTKDDVRNLGQSSHPYTDLPAVGDSDVISLLRSGMWSMRHLPCSCRSMRFHKRHGQLRMFRLAGRHDAGPAGRIHLDRDLRAGLFLKDDCQAFGRLTRYLDFTRPAAIQPHNPVRRVHAQSIVSGKGSPV